MRTIKMNAYVIKAESAIYNVDMTLSRSKTTITDGKGTRAGEDVISICIDDYEPDNDKPRELVLSLSIPEAINMMKALCDLIESKIGEQSEANPIEKKDY